MAVQDFILSLFDVEGGQFFWFTVYLVTILGLLYYGLTYSFGFWASRGVPHPKPVPFFGNAYRYATFKEVALKVHQEYYNRFKGSPYYGTYEFLNPVLHIRDPQLIEQILIKDFLIWMDRDREPDTKLDPLLKHLVNLNGSRWKALRSKLTPVFTPGKLKTMLGELLVCTEHMMRVLDKKTAAGTPIEIKVQMSGMAIDVIGSCAFGLDLNVLENPDSKFMEIGLKIVKFTFLNRIRDMIRRNYPRFLTLTGWKAIPKELESFFIESVQDTVKYREENKVHRNDFIQLMMDIRKQEREQKSATNEILLDDTTFTSNAFVFLLAGFETTATTLSFLLYELAKNPLVQEKLYKEVTDVLKKYKGEITWESIKEMTYLEQCLNEALRKHPPAPQLPRVSNRPYKIPNSNVELPAGSRILIPIYALHHDPQYFPNPEKFIPERFSEENKENLVKFTFLPFGEGPRICIALRFAKVEAKVAVIKLINKYNIHLNPLTSDPLVYGKSGLLSTEGGIWLDFKKRENTTS